jgi:thiamine biosynthesis lipoprotein
MIFVIVIALLVSGCLNAKLTASKPYKETQFLMDTVVEITAYGPQAEEGVKAAFIEFQRLHNITNNYDDSSQLSKINQMAGKSKVVVDPDLVRIVSLSKNVAAKLDDSFDITVGPLSALWGIGHKGDYVPSQAEIEKVLPLVNYRLIEVDSIANTVYLPKIGMMLDLGGVAKG